MIRAGVRAAGGSVTPFSLALLAVLLGGPSPAAAETLIFRNDSEAPVIVQVAGVFRGVFRRDRPHLLRPGDVTSPGVSLPGDKVITIYDAEIPSRVLFQGALPAGPLDRQFRILPDVPHARVRLRPASGP